MSLGQGLGKGGLQVNWAGPKELKITLLSLSGPLNGGSLNTETIERSLVSLSSGLLPWGLSLL